MALFSFAERVRTHPANARLLAWLGVPSEASVEVEPWVDYGYDEGARALFLNYGAALPVAEDGVDPDPDATDPTENV